jgi:hypothetical protein
MKRFVVGLIAGLLLASSTAVASGLVYWKRGGNTYMCEGSGVSVFCKEANWKPAYEIAFIPGAVDVSYHGHLIFNCNRKQTPDFNCSYYGR